MRDDIRGVEEGVHRTRPAGHSLELGQTRMELLHRHHVILLRVPQRQESQKAMKERERSADHLFPMLFCQFMVRKAAGSFARGSWNGGGLFKQILATKLSEELRRVKIQIEVKRNQWEWDRVSTGAQLGAPSSFYLQNVSYFLLFLLLARTTVWADGGSKLNVDAGPPVPCPHGTLYPRPPTASKLPS